MKFKYLSSLVIVTTMLLSLNSTTLIGQTLAQLERQFAQALADEDVKKAEEIVGIISTKEPLLVEKFQLKLDALKHELSGIEMAGGYLQEAEAYKESREQLLEEYLALNRERVKLFAYLEQLVHDVYPEQPQLKVRDLISAETFFKVITTTVNGWRTGLARVQTMIVDEINKILQSDIGSDEKIDQINKLLSRGI